MLSAKMAPRIGRSLAAAGLAVTGMAVPLTTIAALAGARLVTVPLAVLSWLLLAVYAIEACRLWPDLTRGHARAMVIMGELAMFLGLLVGWGFSFGVSIDKGLCGDSPVPLIVGAIAYVAAATFGLQKARFAAGLWFFAVLLGWAVEIGLLFILPGTHGYCET